MKKLIIFMLLVLFGCTSQVVDITGNSVQEIKQPTLEVIEVQNISSSYTKSLNHITHVVVKNQTIDHPVFVGDQQLKYSVLVDRGYLRRVGFLTAYSSKDGVLGELLGVGHHFEGSFNQLRVPLFYLPKDTEQIAVVVHFDTDNDENFNNDKNPAVDGPAIVEGKIVKEILKVKQI